MFPTVSETVIVQLALNTQLIAGALTSTTLSFCASAAPGNIASAASTINEPRIVPSPPHVECGECGPDLRSMQGEVAAFSAQAAGFIWGLGVDWEIRISSSVTSA